MSEPIKFTILGQPCSKANSRRIMLPFAKAGKERHPMVVKSPEALAYEKSALKQIPPAARQRLEGPCRITIHIWYKNELSDLDPSIVLDVLQDRWERVGAERVHTHRGVVRNDRQFREMHLFHGIDKANPRAEIEVEPLMPQQQDILVGVPCVIGQLETAPF